MVREMTSFVRATGALTMLSLLKSYRAFVPAAPLRLSGRLSSECVASSRRSFGCHVLARARPTSTTMLALPGDSRQYQRRGDGQGYGERGLVGEQRLAGARGKASMSAVAAVSGTVSHASRTSSTTLEQVGRLIGVAVNSSSTVRDNHSVALCECRWCWG